MRNLIALFVLSAILCASGYAQTAVLPDRFGQWEAAGPSKFVKANELGTNWAQWTNGEKVLQESGLTRIEQRAYRNGNDEATFRVFALKDPSSAYEFYTFLLAPGMRNLGLGEDSVLSQYDGRILVGNFVVQATL